MVGDLFINATILITFITLGNQVFRNLRLDSKASSALPVMIGLFSGILGCILMIFSVEINSTIIVDFRNIAIILGAILGSFSSSMLAGTIMALFRGWYFGFSPSSVAAALAILIMAIGTPLIAGRTQSTAKKWTYSSLFCVFVGSATFSLLVPDRVVLIELLLTYWAGSALVTYAVYRYTESLTASNYLFDKYKQDASKDFLTGLNNVREFENVFNAIKANFLATSESLSFLFIDIDHFKRVNDTYGHAEGDLVLNQLSSILLKSCRDIDVVSRNGGEEFSVILIGCSLRLAEVIAERIRSTIERHSFILSNGTMISITISIGLATYPDSTGNLDDLIALADKALYRAKESGRNQVAVA